MSKSATDFLQALLAVMLGNLAYFALERYLPSWAQHVGFRTDLGTLVDFCFCLVTFAAIKTISAKTARQKLPKG
ncbi:MAG TPA: hypothetical protein VKR57_04515 [Terriglobales bacterium]|jgi:hypothetical protein|nr:hypothetical protein [Terriglobales bacterium]